MKKLVTLLALIGIAFNSEASIATEISGSPGSGATVDLTDTSLTAWGYAAGALNGGFTTKSGTTAPTVNLVGSSGATTDYGWDFTTAGPVTSSASGGVAGMANGEGWDLTFADIVTSQTQTLTLYLGGYANIPGGDAITITVDSKLTGGTADETGTARAYTADETTVTGKIMTEIYTVEFKSDTETDLVLNFRASGTSGGRTAGVSGYTLEAVAEPGPDAPTGLAATAGNGLVSLDWDDNTGSNLTYSVYRSTNSSSYGSALTNGLVSSDYTDSTVSNYTTYYYVVTAVDTNSVESDPSNEVSATPADPSNQAPAFTFDPVVEINALEGAAYSSTISDDASDPESDPMSFSKVSGPAWLSVAPDGGLSGTPASTNVGLNSFTIQVTAAGGSGTAELQITVDADTTPPGAPTGLAAVAGNGSVSLSWNDNPETDLGGYNIYRSTNSGNYSSALASNLTSSSYTDNAAANGTAYYYVVCAVDESSNSNESTPSSEVSATPDASALQPLVWLDAGQGVALDAGNVAVWTNLASPGTFNAVQANASKRPVVLSDEPLLPGKSMLYFDGNDDLLALEGTQSSGLFDGDLTVFVVSRRRENADSGSQGFLGNLQPGSEFNQGWTVVASDSGSYGYRTGNGDSQTISVGLGGIDNFAIANTRYSDLGGGSAKMELFTSLSEETVSSTISPVADASTTDIGIGGFANWKSLSLDRFVECDIAEVRIYAGALSDEDRQSVWDELSAKYTIVTKKIFDVTGFQPGGQNVPADTTIQITFDSPMNADSMTNMIVGAGGLDGYPEGGDWTRVSGQWAASVPDTVFTFTPDQPFAPGELVMCEVPTNVLSAQGGSFKGTRRGSMHSFVVDTGTTYPASYTLIDPMAVVSNEYVDGGVTNTVDHVLPMGLTVPETDEPCPIILWVHGGSFNGGNTGTLTNSSESTAVMADYFSEKLGIAVASVAWRSTLSEGTFTKAVSDINTAIQYVRDNAESLNIDTSRMALYGGSAGTPMSSLISQLDTNIVCYIGFNGSYNFVEGGYKAGGTSFGQNDPSWEANSAIFNIRTNNPPPTLLMHGTADPLISPQQSVLYAQAIADAGGEATALLYQDEEHSFYNDPPAYNPCLVASSEFLSRIFGLGIYQAGYAKWLTDNGVADTVANFYEYAMNSDPTDGLAPTNRPVLTRAGNGFRYVHPQRSDDEALIYTVETTTNLLDSSSWTNVGYMAVGTNVTGGTLNFVTNDVDAAEDEKFIRLRIWQ